MYKGHLYMEKDSKMTPFPARESLSRIGRLFQIPKLNPTATNPSTIYVPVVPDIGNGPGEIHRGGHGIEAMSTPHCGQGTCQHGEGAWKAAEGDTLRRWRFGVEGHQVTGDTKRTWPDHHTPVDWVECE
jgi:hypothetical protein